MTGVKDWVLIVPAPGEQKATIRALLDLADSVTDVRTGANRDLLVAPYVAERFMQIKKPRARRTKED